MPKGRDIDTLLRPLSEKPIQAYFGQGLHTLGMLGWLLRQTGKADIYVSSYSTSEPFLNGVVRLHEAGVIGRSILLLDQRAARKTVQLERLMANAFEHVLLGQNHSKLLLVTNANWTVSVVTSQNQTYGARSESTIICTVAQVFDSLQQQFFSIIANGAVEIDIENGRGIITQSGRTCQTDVDAEPDWRPHGAEW